MCGIVGYIGNQKACPILLAGLSKLEYRGYDSAGISTIENNTLSLVKEKGRVKDLENQKEINSLNGTIGIAHTRWATHGKPSKENSHPHQDNSKTFSVVHNGIIENYQEIRKKLQEQGYTFLSETDSEVIPNLIHFYYEKETKKERKSFFQAVQNTCLDLKGSYAIEIISSLSPDEMIVVRKDSPLVIGKGDKEYFISSDIPAILSYTKEFYLLNDLEFAIVNKNNITFYNTNSKEIQKETQKINWNASAAEKEGYEDFMLKEIFDQPTAIRETIGTCISPNEICKIESLTYSTEYLKSIDRIYIVACGTAMHAGLSGKQAFEKLCHIPTEVDVASEFRYRDPLLSEKTLCVFISQSGETADTIAALKLAKEKGARTLAISNVIGSSITREADDSIYTHAGPEIAVASTKAYTSQVMLITILAIYMAQQLGTNNQQELESLKQEILTLPNQIEKTLICKTQVQEFAKKIYQEQDIFFLGRGIDETVAKEGSLKLKEISYIHSESYPAGELKHGPIALIEDDVTVISIMTDTKLAPKTMSNIQEVITRGAKTFVVSNQEIKGNEFDETILIPKTSPFISPILSIIPLQLLAYYISKEKGLDVDKPRNLAKSVTVE